MTQHVLYGGRLTVEFEEATHKYTCNGESGWFSCSRAESAVDLGKAGAFAWWSVNEMRDYMLENRPLAVDGSPAVVDPMLYEDLIKQGRLAHNKAKDEAADVGRKVHDWIDLYVKSKMSFGDPPELPENEQIKTCLRAFLEHERNHSIQYEESERVVASMEHRYIGTMDRAAAIISLDGIRSIRDTKTANGMRKGFRLQLAGYAMAYNEEFPEKKIWKRVIELLGKEEATFTAVDLKYDGMTDEESTLVDFGAFLRALWLLEWDVRAEAAQPKEERKKKG